MLGVDPSGGSFRVRLLRATRSDLDRVVYKDGFAGRATNNTAMKSFVISLSAFGDLPGAFVVRWSLCNGRTVFDPGDTAGR